MDTDPTRFEWIGKFFTSQVWWLKVGFQLGYRYCLPEPNPKYINEKNDNIYIYKKKKKKKKKKIRVPLLAVISLPHSL